MKKCWILILVLVMLAGCGQPAEPETVSDVYAPQELPAARQIVVQLPPEVYTPTFQTEGESLYLCDRYSVSVGTFEAGDLQRTVYNAAGFLPEKLQMQQTVQEGVKRYSFTWSAASEEGTQVGRGCVLDDGSHHYVLTAMTAEADAGALQSTWHELFSSFRLADPEMDLNTGS